MSCGGWEAIETVHPQGDEGQESIALPARECLKGEAVTSDVREHL